MKQRQYTAPKIKVSHPNRPGGTSEALQLMYNKWLKIKAAYDILVDAIKIKAYDFEYNVLRFKWVRLTHFDLDESVGSYMQNQRYKKRKEAIYQERNLSPIYLVVNLYKKIPADKLLTGRSEQSLKG